MPVQVSYPGVYVEELPSAVRTITGVPTSITAFVGRAWRGPVDEPVKISSYADYERTFGGLWRDSPMSYAVQQFFLNGGSQAIIVRVATRKNATATPEATPATFTFTGGTFMAANPGSWGTNLTITRRGQQEDEGSDSDPALFNLKVFDDPDLKNDAIKRGGSGAREAFLNVSSDPASPRFVGTILEQQSQLLRVDATTLSATAARWGGNHAASDRRDHGRGRRRFRDRRQTPGRTRRGRKRGRQGRRRQRSSKTGHVRALEDRHLQPPLHPALRARHRRQRHHHHLDDGGEVLQGPSRVPARRRRAQAGTCPPPSPASEHSARSTAPTRPSTSRACASPIRSRTATSPTSRPAARSPAS